MKVICTKCNLEKDLETEFYVNKNSKSGYMSWCKECTKANTLKNYYNNWDDRRKSNNEYYQLNKKHRSKQFREIHQIKKDYYRNKVKEWTNNHPEKIKEYNKKRRDRNHQITKDEWEYCKNYFNYQCAYCGLSIDDQRLKYNKDFNKEHVNHEGLSDLSNCVPACTSCNASKWKYSLDEWYNNEKEIFSEQRLDKIIKWLSGDFYHEIRKGRAKG